MTDKYHKLDNFENVLKQKQTKDFNQRFFLNVKEKSKIHFQGIKNLDPTANIYKKNVQNNYYYVNGE